MNQNSEPKSLSLSKTDLILLAIFSLLVIGNQILWISQDFSPPAGDALGHIATSFQVLRLLFNGEIHRIFMVSNVYPPLIYSYTGFFYLFAGYSTFTALLSVILLLPIYIYFTFLLGLHLGGRICAWISTIIATCAPLTLHFLNQYYMEFPLAVLIIICVYFLYRCENFENRKYSIWLGIFTGIAFLCKINFWFYFSVFFILTILFNKNFWKLPPLVYIISGAILFPSAYIIKTWIRHAPVPFCMWIREYFFLIYLIALIFCIFLLYKIGKIENKLPSEKKEKFNPAFNLLNFLIIHASITLPWFIALTPNFRPYRENLPRPVHHTMPLEKLIPVQLDTIGSAFPGALFFLVIGFVVFIYIAWKIPDFFVKYNIIISMFFEIFAIQYGVIATLGFPNTRYPVPTIPLLGLCSFYYLKFIKFSPLRALILFLAGLSGIWSATAWLLPDWLPSKYAFPLSYIKTMRSPRVVYETSSYVFRFQLFDTVAERITDDIFKDMKQSGKKGPVNFIWIGEIGKIGDSRYFMGTLAYHSALRGILFSVVYLGPDPIGYYDRIFFDSKADYVLAHHLPGAFNIQDNPNKLSSTRIYAKLLRKYHILYTIEDKPGEEKYPLFLYRIEK